MPIVVVGSKKNHRLTYTITAVHVVEDHTVADYRHTNAHDIDEVLKDIKDIKSWACEFEYDEKNEKVTRVHALIWPNAPGHPGHVHGTGAWKYNIERTNNTVDRLVLENWQAPVSHQENHGVGKLKGMTEISASVAITVHARALKDTH